MQKLQLVNSRWDALMKGEKTDTIRINEGAIEPGFLVYESFPEPTDSTVVFVTSTRNIPLRAVMRYTADLARKPTQDALLERMKPHYPDITLETEVLYIQHLTPAETAARHPDEIKEIASNLERP